jgi:hypothetical protein
VVLTEAERELDGTFEALGGCSPFVPQFGKPLPEMLASFSRPKPFEEFDSVLRWIFHRIIATVRACSSVDEARSGHVAC